MPPALTVLVVDDEPKICDLLGQLLTSRGCDVRFAANGIDALAQFRQRPADVVITDIKMPKMGGMELLDELKTIDPLINVVVITAFPSVEGAVEIMKHGACDFITKPFELVQIQALLHRCQQRLSLSRQLRSAGEGMVKLEELNRRLAELNDLKSQFLAALSHEINTPLCLMSEWMYLLNDGTLGQLTDDQEHAVGVLITAYERLHRLLQQLIDLMHGHEIVLRRQATTAQELLQPIVTAMTLKAASKGVALSAKLAQAPLPLEIDRGRCAAAFEYLIDNAIKFNRPSGKVDIEMSSDPGEVRVVIRDNGIGIAPEELDKVFAPFYQVDHRLNRVYEGAGIGLSLAKRYVELHNGLLRLESSPDTGTTVTVTLPRAAAGSRPPRLPSTPL